MRILSVVEAGDRPTRHDFRVPGAEVEEYTLPGQCGRVPWIRITYATGKVLEFNVAHLMVIERIDDPAVVRSGDRFRAARVAIEELADDPASIPEQTIKELRAVRGLCEAAMRDLLEGRECIEL